MYYPFPALLLLCLIELASGSLVAGIVSKSTVTSTSCWTRLSTSSRKDAVPTGRSTTTILPQVKLVISRSTPSKIVTPSTSTSIATSTTTVSTIFTDSTVTDTLTTTSTVTSIITESPTTTVISISTISETSTSTSSVIVAAPSGFQSISDTSGDSTLAKREIFHPHGLRSRAVSNQLPFSPKKQSFPFSVTCKAVVQVRYTDVIVLVSPKTTTITAPTPVVTSTTTITSTSTITVAPPHITNTETDFTTTSTTTTSSQTTTSITSTTETITVQASTTVYAACATANLLGPKITGGDIIDVAYYNAGSGNPQLNTGITDAYDCCVACLLDGSCGISLFDPNVGCSYLNGMTCSAGQASNPAGNLNFRHQPAGQNSGSSVVSNGPCGVATDGGQG
ncbi:hypothetical protein D6D20_06384 [Aureobasidium pullulans]|uniref:Apple domain-containing protein n=1 Tax=Aureobasidium pullulans TaxID=5580 RepID=A0A4S9Z9A5_AURPU|nr:hypothetical protein D6D20_06384 [Aureobasidium pullulans]TIA03361.1 hypothetical protein D6C82_01934 [Aureobasidium pullulans]